VFPFYEETLLLGLFLRSLASFACNILNLFLHPFLSFRHFNRSSRVSLLSPLAALRGASLISLVVFQPLRRNNFLLHWGRDCRLFNFLPEILASPSRWLLIPGKRIKSPRNFPSILASPYTPGYAAQMTCFLPSAHPKRPPKPSNRP